jgi:hypothetical protein
MDWFGALKTRALCIPQVCAATGQEEIDPRRSQSRAPLIVTLRFSGAQKEETIIKGHEQKDIQLQIKPFNRPPGTGCN